MAKTKVYHNNAWVNSGGGNPFDGTVLTASFPKHINDTLSASSKTTVGKLTSLSTSAVYSVSAFFSANVSTAGNGITDIQLRKKKSDDTWEVIALADIIGTAATERKVSLSAVTVTGAKEIDLYVWVSSAYSLTIKAMALNGFRIK